MNASIPANSEVAYRCEQAVLRFMAHFDAGEYAEMEAYFSRDGVWKRHGGDIIGHAGLRMLPKHTDRVIRHVISNMRTTLLAADHAVVDAYMCFYAHIYGASQPAGPLPFDGPVIMGRYRDELRLEADTWKITRHEPTHDFRRQP